MSYCCFFGAVFQCVGYAAQALVDHTSRSRHIHAHEACALGAEHGSVVESQFGVFYKEIGQLLMAEAESAAVKPYQERCLRAVHSDPS